MGGEKNEKWGKAYVWVDYTVLTVLDTSYTYGGALKQNIAVVFSSCSPFYKMPNCKLSSNSKKKKKCYDTVIMVTSQILWSITVIIKPLPLTQHLHLAWHGTV